MAKFGEGAVVQLVGNGKKHCAACSRVFDGSAKQYHKDDHPWVVMAIHGKDKELVPCGRTGYLVSPLAHDPTKHGGKDSVELDPFMLPPGIYDNDKGKHFLVHTVCGVVAHDELRHHTFGPTKRPVSLASKENMLFWAEAKVEHHARWKKARLLPLYTCWCERVLGIEPKHGKNS